MEKGIDGRVIMISGHGTVETAVQAIKVGAFDFIQKPLDLNRILLTVRHALDQGQLEQETERLTRKIQTERSTAIVGDSPAIREIVELICTVAPSDARVLITGANGTGKELVARQLHELSARHNAPFVEVNCAAIPSDLIESELFGHEKRFTSAVKQRKGKFEQAQGGTLFLDEIGDMSASPRPKCFARCKKTAYHGLVERKKLKWMCVWWQRPIRTCVRKLPRGISGRTCTTGWR